MSKADMIRDLLRECGPMTVSQLARLVPEMSQGNLSKALGWMAFCTKNPNKRVHIREWVYVDEIGRYYPRPLYAAGVGRNVLKPKPLTNSQRVRRYAKKKRVVAPASPNSVWQLGAKL